MANTIVDNCVAWMFATIQQTMLSLPIKEFMVIMTKVAGAHQSAAAVPGRLSIAEQSVVVTAPPAAPLPALITHSESSSAPTSGSYYSLFSRLSASALISESSHSSGSLFTASNSHSSIFCAQTLVPLLPQPPLNTRVSYTYGGGSAVYTQRGRGRGSQG